MISLLFKLKYGSFRNKICNSNYYKFEFAYFLQRKTNLEICTGLKIQTMRASLLFLYFNSYCNTNYKDVIAAYRTIVQTTTMLNRKEAYSFNMSLVCTLDENDGLIKMKL